MIDGVSEERFASMKPRESRWLDNVKKAVFASDEAYMRGQREDICFPELCKAVDTAKTLQRSLRDQDVSTGSNKVRFIEFLEQGVPHPSDGGYESRPLIDARDGRSLQYTFGGLVYAIRCMIHENENLNSAEQPDYHIRLDWEAQTPSFAFARQYSDRVLVLNAEMCLERLRQCVAHFVTAIDSSIAFLERGQFCFTIRPALGSIRPGENFVYASLKEGS